MGDDFGQLDSNLTVGQAILVGQLVVNMPVLAIMAAGFVVGLSLLPAYFWAVFLAAFVTAWLWWSLSVPRWRMWAINKGVSAGKLHYWAVLTGLEWPKGSVFSKTEFKVKDQ